MNTNMKNLYSRNNQIRTKLLLFIDKEIQSKIKQPIKNLKFKCIDESLIKINVEETFTHKKSKKRDFSFTNTLKTKKTDNSEKSVSTNDDNSNKTSEKSNKKKKIITSSRTLSRDAVCRSNKLINNVICFNKKIYSIKNVSKRSSAFLILPKQKNAAEYLKNLCNNLKISKNKKKPIQKCGTVKIKNKRFNLSQDKKVSKKSNKNLNPKSKMDNQYTFSLFKKPQNENILINPKPAHRKSVNSVCIKFLKNE